jgi:hypothetical protein
MLRTAGSGLAVLLLLVGCARPRSSLPNPVFLDDVERAALGCYRLETAGWKNAMTMRPAALTYEAFVVPHLIQLHQDLLIERRTGVRERRVTVPSAASPHAFTVMHWSRRPGTDSIVISLFAGFSGVRIAAWLVGDSLKGSAAAVSDFTSSTARAEVLGWRTSCGAGC